MSSELLGTHWSCSELLGAARSCTELLETARNSSELFGAARSCSGSRLALGKPWANGISNVTLRGYLTPPPLPTPPRSPCRRPLTPSPPGTGLIHGPARTRGGTRGTDWLYPAHSGMSSAPALVSPSLPPISTHPTPPALPSQLTLPFCLPSTTISISAHVL